MNKIISFLKEKWLYILLIGLGILAFITMILPKFKKVNKQIVKSVENTLEKIQENENKNIESKAKYEITKKVIEEKKEEKLQELNEIVTDNTISTSEKNRKLNEFHNSIKKFK